MLREEKIDGIIEDLVASGSDADEIKRVRDKVLDITNKDRSFNEVMEDIGLSVKDNTLEFLHDTNKDGVRYVEGISSDIYVADFDKGDSSIKVVGGKTSRDKNRALNIDDNTLFDVASITKLYTLIFAYTVENLGFNLNTPVGMIIPKYDLGDFTINDLIRLCGELATDGRINDAKNVLEAYRILRTAYLKSDNRNENKYTDIGAMIIGDALTTWLNQKYRVHYSFERWMNELVFDPMNLKNTMYNPSSNNITGIGNNVGVHDPKARALDGVSGHAGIFTNSSDLEKLAKGIFAVSHNLTSKMNDKLYLTRAQIGKMGEITFPNAIAQKGNLGIYVKHPLGLEKTYAPSAFSTGSFAHQGWTGSVATFDPNNMIHQNILVNAIYDPEDKTKVKSDKPIGFMARDDKYIKTLNDDTMVMYIAKKYYDKYINKDKMDRNVTFRVR